MIMGGTIEAIDSRAAGMPRRILVGVCYTFRDAWAKHLVIFPQLKDH